MLSDLRALAPKLPGLLFLLLLGLAGALLARALGLPIPFLLGSLVCVATYAIVTFARTGNRPWYPKPLRTTFIAVIGVLIGSTFKADMAGELPRIWITILAMVPFVFVAHAIGYGIFRHIGRYDPVTATYAAMPGGLIEAVSLGEKAGGDVETLSIQHFLRIVIVVVTIPTLFYLWTGEAVGSAAGQHLNASPVEVTDWLIIATLALVGAVLGIKLRLPAGHMIGPLALTATLQATGVVDISGPAILLNGAQLIVGVGLGATFARTTLRHLLSCLGLGILVVTVLLGLGFGIATLLAPLSPMPFEALLISFAPGGVTEMGLIALSLDVSPALVAAHHLFRISFTVTVIPILARRATSR